MFNKLSLNQANVIVRQVVGISSQNLPSVYHSLKEGDQKILAQAFAIVNGKQNPGKALAGERVAQIGELLNASVKEDSQTSLGFLEKRRFSTLSQKIETYLGQRGMNYVITSLPEACQAFAEEASGKNQQAIEDRIYRLEARYNKACEKQGTVQEAREALMVMEPRKPVVEAYLKIFEGFQTLSANNFQEILPTVIEGEEHKLQAETNAEAKEIRETLLKALKDIKEKLERPKPDLKAKLEEHIAKCEGSLDRLERMISVLTSTNIPSPQEKKNALDQCFLPKRFIGERFWAFKELQELPEDQVRGRFLPMIADEEAKIKAETNPQAKEVRENLLKELKEIKEELREFNLPLELENHVKSYKNNIATLTGMIADQSEIVSTYDVAKPKLEEAVALHMRFEAEYKFKENEFRLRFGNQPTLKLLQPAMKLHKEIVTLWEAVQMQRKIIDEQRKLLRPIEEDLKRNALEKQEIERTWIELAVDLPKIEDHLQNAPLLKGLLIAHYEQEIQELKAVNLKKIKQLQRNQAAFNVFAVGVEPKFYDSESGFQSQKFQSALQSFRQKHQNAAHFDLKNLLEKLGLFSSEQGRETLWNQEKILTPVIGEWEEDYAHQSRLLNFISAGVPGQGDINRAIKNLEEGIQEESSSSEEISLSSTESSDSSEEAYDGFTQVLADSSERLASAIAKLKKLRGE